MSSNNTGRKLLIKLFILFVHIEIFVYATYKLYIDQVEFNGFPNKFLAFIEASLNPVNGIDMKIIVSVLPMFHPPSNVYQFSPSILKGAVSNAAYFPNISILYVILQQITNISPQTLMLLPTMAIFVPLLYFITFRIYVSTVNSEYINPYVILLYIIGLLLLIAKRTAITVLYAGSIGHTLFLVILFWISLIINKSADLYTRNKALIIIVICLISLSQYWHTMLFFTTFYVISMFISAIIFVNITKVINVENYNYLKNILNKYVGLLVISILITITFNHLWQSKYFTIFISETLNLKKVIKDIFLRVIGKQPFELPYIYEYTSTFFFFFFQYSTLASYAIATFLMIFLALKCIKLYIKYNIYELILPILFTSAIIVSEVMQIIAYYASQSINLFYVFMYPLSISLAINALSKINAFRNSFKRIITTMVLILLVTTTLSVISLHCSHELGRTPVTKYEDTKESFEWLHDHKIDDFKVLSDFNIVYKYLQREAKKYKVTTDYQLFTPELYGIIVCDKRDLDYTLSKSYIVIDKATMEEGRPIDIRGSRGFLLKPMLERIFECKYNSKIYEDKYIAILIRQDIN